MEEQVGRDKARKKRWQGDQNVDEERYTDDTQTADRRKRQRASGRVGAGRVRSGRVGSGQKVLKSRGSGRVAS